MLCVFAVAAVLSDHAWPLPGWVRQLNLVAFLAGGGVFLLYYTLCRPLLYRVNPYYAAQRVEQTLPGAKNSIVNWLDLQQQKLSPAIHAAVGQKAAKDLSKADIDHAFSHRRLALAGVVAAACSGGLLASFVWLGGESFSGLQRIFSPFTFGGEARTTIMIARPSNGDDTVTLGRAVFIAARVEGKVPAAPKSGNRAAAADAVKILYRYQENEPYLERAMRADGGEFTATISAIDVRDGFWYKVAAGDVETPEYRISVRSTPLLTKVTTTYHFRPYVGRENTDRYSKRPIKLEALRGTEITIQAHANRPVKEAFLVVEGKEGKVRQEAEKSEDDPQAFTVKFVVDGQTSYRLEYTTPDNEGYADPIFQEIVAIPDLPPKPVELVSPGNVSLPCNGVLQVEGSAADDVGVKSLALKMRVSGGAELKEKPYRTDKELHLLSGGYARTLAYKDFVDLKTVQTLDAKPFALAAGMELEYWLQASDACDYPLPNVSESQHYRVKLLPPENEQEKQNGEREQAKREQQQHEEKQNESLKKEEQKRHQDEQRRQEEAQQEKNEVDQSGKQPNGSEQEPPQKEQPKNQQGGQGNPEKQKQDAEATKRAEDLKKALDKKNQQGQSPHSESKPDRAPEQDKSSESKDAGQKPDAQNAPSQPKPENKSDPAHPPSEKKQPPKPAEHKESAHEKDEGKSSDQECTKGDCKNGGVTTNPDSHDGSPKPQPSPASDKGEGKSGWQGESRYHPECTAEARRHSGQQRE